MAGSLPFQLLGGIFILCHKNQTAGILIQTTDGTKQRLLRQQSVMPGQITEQRIRIVPVTRVDHQSCGLVYKRDIFIFKSDRYRTLSRCNLLSSVVGHIENKAVPCVKYTPCGHTLAINQNAVLTKLHRTQKSPGQTGYIAGLGVYRQTLCLRFNDI